jgi:hypothetical protein
MNMVTAVFDDRRDAELAVQWLRNRGVPDANISVLTRDATGVPTHSIHPEKEGVAADPGSDLARGAGTGLAAGAGVGALFGLAATLIPGIGPFIGAGALVSLLGATGAAAATGAIVGGASGLIAGALSKWGLDKADADYYGEAIERGATFVAAELAGTGLNQEQVLEAFRVFTGRSAGADRTHRDARAA